MSGPILGWDHAPLQRCEVILRKIIKISLVHYSLSGFGNHFLDGIRRMFFLSEILPELLIQIENKKILCQFSACIIDWLPNLSLVAVPKLHLNLGVRHLL